MTDCTSLGTEARRIMDGKTKPQGSLGCLEDWAVRLADIQATVTPKADNVHCLVFAGDHGVAINHAVSAFPSAVTVPVFKSIAAGLAAVNVIAESTGGSTVHLIDVGIHFDGAVPLTRHSGAVLVKHARVCNGTKDITTEAAMSEAEVETALQVGADAADRAIENGAQVLCVGEIGIGNTTSSAALLSAITGFQAKETTGLGTGLSQEQWQAKCDTVQTAVDRATGLHKRSGSSACVDSDTAMSYLAELGGLEICAMVGAMIRASKVGCVVLVDGFICGVAALIALCIEGSSVGKHLLLTHQSAESGTALLIKSMQERGCPIPPPLSMRLRLGEGTGALLCVPLLRAACAVLEGMGSLQETLEL